MKRIKSNIEKRLFANNIFRKILYTGRYLHVELLKIKSGAKIDLESHLSMDQFFGFEGGKGRCIVEGREYIVESGDVLVIPAGSRDEVTKFDFHNRANSTNNFFTDDHKHGLMNKTNNDSGTN